MTPDQARARFDAVLASYYQAWLRFHPEAAVDAGVPGYAHLLTPYGPETVTGLACLNDELCVSLDELDGSALDADRRVDYALAYGAARLENQHLLELESQRPDPNKLLPVRAIHQLLERPVADFAGALLARLNAIPGHLQGAQALLRDRAAELPPVWLHAAVRAARRGAAFLRELPAHPKIAAAGLPGVGAVADRAAGSLIAHADFMERELAPAAAGDFACGASYFQHLLWTRHFLDVSVDDLHALGTELFAHTERNLRDACRELYGHTDVAQATRRVQAEHPAAGELLAVYRRQVQAARDFVAARGLVTLPAVEHLEVIETPVFLRHQIPFAAYSEPAPNDPQQRGYYYVTPPETEEQLAEHDHAGLMHTCVHEAWPGHHLQFVTANLNPVARTLPRLLNASATLYEGWALYCEQLMHEQGFLDRPASRFLLLKDRLWRALRILIDVEIHTRGLSLEAAADRMVAHLGFPRAQALADLTWYSRSPGVPLGYATGWALINALRDRARLERGFDLKAFHDRLLSAGSIALPLVIRRQFGEPMWETVRGMIFSEVTHEPS